MAAVLRHRAKAGKRRMLNTSKHANPKFFNI
jgi:hypothetical protein